LVGGDVWFIALAVESQRSDFLVIRASANCVPRILATWIRSLGQNPGPVELLGCRLRFHFSQTEGVLDATALSTATFI